MRRLSPYALVTALVGLPLAGPPLLGLMALSGCTEAPAPRESGAAPRGSSEMPAPTASAAPSARASALPVVPPTSAAPAPSVASTVTLDIGGIDLASHPALLDGDGKPLPQTDERPTTTSPAFQRRMEVLWDAIVKDDPTIATDAVFFPKVAYAQVKDIAKPEADWKSRLVRAFERNVHEYHRKLGDEPTRARLVAIDVDDTRVKLMERGKEGNKLPYHRVTRSKLRFVDAAGKDKTLELTSLIAWRGEWFVVHLNGFK